MSRRNGTAAEAFELPEGLSVRSQRVWKAEAGPRGRTHSDARRLVLEQCLRHLDRADALRRAIETEGTTSTTKTTGAVHINPLLKVEQVERAMFAKLAKILTLEW